MHDLSSKIMSDIILHMKYAKFIPEKQRRENWNEVVTRNKKMHIDKYPHLIDEIENAYKLVYEKKVLPSMRSLQFGGKPIELNPARGYNCSALHVDHPDAFPEIMFLLLSGCFEKGTMVKTKNGDKPIEEITTEDEVLTFDENSKEYYWINPLFAGETPTEEKEKIELEFENGDIIRCTSDHKFYTTNRGWVEAKDLTEEDNIENYNE